MGGFFFRRNDAGVLLTGYFRALGELNVLGFISVSVQFWLSLTYEQRRLSNGESKAWLVGECSITVEISFAFFSVSVGISLRKEFSGDSGGTSGAYYLAPDRLGQIRALVSNDRDYLVPQPPADWRPAYLRYMETYAW
jgi:hypothetical protein